MQPLELISMNGTHAPRRPHRNLMINSVPYDWDDAQLTTFFSSYGLLEAGGPIWTTASSPTHNPVLSETPFPTRGQQAPQTNK